MGTQGHIPVLVDAVLDALVPRVGATILDCTVGRGGHAALLAERMGPSGTIIGVDLDDGNLRFAQERVEAIGAARFVPVHASFADAPARVRELGLRCDGVLADLGFASTQIDDAQRGLSFTSDGPLDMRYDRSRGRTAAELLAKLSERDLCNTILKLGEDPLAPKIAKRIVQVRQRSPIGTTHQLGELVREVYGPRARQSRLHPATRTFMALRIAVNDELNALAALLREIAQGAEAARALPSPAPAGEGGGRSEPGEGGVGRRPPRLRDGEGSVATPPSPPASRDPLPPFEGPQGRQAGEGRTRATAPASAWLNPGARLAVISFHSLEDRLVKHAFAELVGSGLATAITRKPITATDQELAANPRSRSAKLRAVEVRGTGRA